jgi:hypothetical protein
VGQNREPDIESQKYTNLSLIIKYNYKKGYLFQLSIYQVNIQKLIAFLCSSKKELKNEIKIQYFYMISISWDTIASQKSMKCVWELWLLKLSVHVDVT